MAKKKVKDDWEGEGKTQKKRIVKEEAGGRLFNTPRASESRSHVDHLHATDTLIVCLLTRSIQRDALRSADGVHTRLPDAPEASYCSRGPDEPNQSLSRGTREFEIGKAERDGSRNSSPFLSAAKHPNKGLRKALPPDADVLADV